MTQDDKLTRFLGILADHKAELGLSPSVYGFADDSRFTFNLSPAMRKFANSLFYKYGPALGINHLDDPIPKKIVVDLSKVRK
jgi:hypothetical protein